MFFHGNPKNPKNHENHENGWFSRKVRKWAKSATFCEKAHFSGPGLKSFHSSRNIDGFGSPKCTLGQKVRFLMKMVKIHEIHEKSTFPWKSWKSALFEVKITSRNGHLSNAKSTFSFSGGNFTKFPEISRNFMKFHEISWISTIFMKIWDSGPNETQIADPRRLCSGRAPFGAQFRPKVHFGAKSSKMEDFRNFSWFSLNSAKFR